MKKDIETIEDVRLMVDSFYDKVKRDEVIGFFFNEIARVNWDTHLNKMYAFWGNILLGTNEYNGAPFPPHYKLHQQVRMEKHHFRHWVDLFVTTVDEHFEGEKAIEAKSRGVQIAAVWFHKLSHFGQPITATTTDTPS